LFINAVLRALKIPYLTRYTNYKKGERNFKHVYTVALIDNTELPIDSVYNVFGKEKKYNLKKDYLMTEIVEISGFGNSKRNRKSFVVPKRQEIKPLASAVKRIEETRQKQKYVTEQPEIRFSKVSEGTAILQLAERELTLIKTMQPDKRVDAEIGIDLIRKALKGDFTASGQRIPQSLAGTVSKIRTAEEWSTIPANNFGYMETQLSELKTQKQKSLQKAQIGSLNFPSRNCLQQGMWYQAGMMADNCNATKCTIKPTMNYGTNDSIQKNHEGWGGICKTHMEGAQNISFPPAYFSGGKESFINDAKTIPSTLGDFIFFHYGRNSKYRQSYNKSYQKVNVEFQKLLNEGVFTGHNWQKWEYDRMVQGETYGRYSVNIQSEEAYKSAMIRLNGSSGVLDSYISDIFRADQTVQGTMGSGLIYTFLSSTGNPMNGFPVTTLTKMGFQDQFIDSAQFFSNVSRSSIMALSRNGILYDNAGEQPEKTLKYLLSLYDGTNTSLNAGIGCAGICTSIVLAIIAAVVTISSAIISAVASGNQASTQASNIDSIQKDKSNFQPLTENKMLNENDWLPDIFKGEEGSKNIALVLGALGIGAYAVLGDKKKK